ncbi:MAG TPA: hypothetical protein VFD92_03380 [Candidatus Binatia bacterium]|nr:hypothetical protein [Candidatus Binatia bacterium]
MDKLQNPRALAATADRRTHWPARAMIGGAFRIAGAGAVARAGAAALALALVGSAEPASAGDSCETALTLAATTLAQCTYAAEAAFAKNENEGRRDAALQRCREQFDTSFARARGAFGGECPATAPTSTFQSYVAQTAGTAVAAAGGGSLAAAPDVCTVASGVTTLVVTNNCSSAKSVTFAAGSTGQASPSCLQNLAANGGTGTAYLSTSNLNYAFWTGSYGSSSLFELNVNPGGIGTDNFDISFNQGFDIGMTIVAPTGTSIPYIVATDATAPGAYQTAQNQPQCYTAPCLSPNYNATTGGTWNLYLCNGAPSIPNVNTPGPCGCSVCPCQCNWQDVTCKGQPTPGQNGCPLDCPNS